MYLKSIEIQGFKSFANKMNFEFHNGITAIVGPNGSGKSNVADAVRWVLGEQKVKQLRGAKMEDVIFSGTEMRKPIGFAYVAITLDNSDHQLAIDFDEVKVSRRIFRSGESEYMINGSACRLKDVNELFYDTGIGKEGYSIIGQGQIEKILSGKPEERRELFDEAAGIVKFKRRKTVSIKKLEEEHLNLTRVKDILSELEKQIQPLEKQSEVAKTYLRLKEEQKIYDVNMFLIETKDKKDELSELNEKYNLVSADIRYTKDELDRIKNDSRQAGTLIDELNQEIEDKKALLNDKNLKKEKDEGEINVFNEQINSVKLNDSHINERIAGINDSMESLKNELSDLAEQKQNIKNDLEAKNEELRIKSEQLSQISNEISEITLQIDNSKSEIIEILNEKSNVKAKVQRYETMLEQIDKRKAELNEQLEKYGQDKENQDQYYEKLENEYNQVVQNLKSIKSLLDEKTEEINKLEVENNNLSRNYQDSLNKYHKEELKLESLKNLTERYEGYGNSIRKVMELRDNKKGIIGVVADIIKVDKQYEIAIETCLGGNIQNIVTDTEKTAKDIIEYLKKNKLGRATFLPLNSISNKTGFNNERALSEKGVIGLACDLVNIQKEYEAIAKYLLGRIVVVDHIDNAIALARKFNHTLRIVTLEGELLNIGGSLTGGAYKNNSNLLGRRREIEDIEKNIKVLTGELKEIKASIDTNQLALNERKTQLDDTKLKMQEQILLQNTVEINLKQADLKKQELISRYDSIHKESDEILGQIKDIELNNNELSESIRTLEAKNSEIEESILKFTEALEAKKENEAIQIKENEELRMACQSLTQRKTFAQDNIDRISSEIQKYQKELSSIYENRMEISKDIDEKQKLIEEKKQNIQTILSEIEILKEQIDECIKNKEQQSLEHKEYLDKRDYYSERINALDKELFRLEARKEKLEESYESQINYIWDEYALTYNSALELKNEDYNNLSGLKKLLEKTKQDIRNLGDVNVGAIEEFKTVSERYEFLKTQHDDLIKAEESLIKIIDELDQGMRKQFSEQFVVIKSEFNKVFKELFGGGTGDIELVEGEDILEAGVNIIAQPPGKKLQNIMQLSGGEKALTAIALLFAIQNLKPSPFCLLDEIEAALDDSNVIRFSDYLHKLTKNTQFIVITHRKGTMASADRLYGITMQEKGVSTLVSVNLLESQLRA